MGEVISFPDRHVWLVMFESSDETSTMTVHADERECCVDVVVSNEEESFTKRLDKTDIKKLHEKLGKLLNQHD